MGRLLSTVALAAVLAGLVGYIYFVDSKTPVGEAARPNAFDVEADQIDQIQVTSEAGAQSTLSKDGDTWKLTAPTEAPADSAAASALVGSLAGLGIERVVDEHPAGLKDYGLDPARVTVSFRVKGEQTPHRLLIGAKTPTGGDLYAKLPDQPRVFLISAYLDGTFNKSPFDLRDKQLLTFDVNTADGLEVTENGRTTMQLAKDGATWRLVQPLKVRGDYAEIAAMLTGLSAAKMKAVVAEQADDPAPYGLDHPAMTITVSTGSARATLDLGRTVGGATFAKDAARPTIFTVDPGVADDFRKDPESYRNKDIFDFRSFTADHVELTRGGTTTTLDRTRGGDGADTWKNGDGKTLDATKVEDFLTKLSGLRAQVFQATADPSLASPDLSATIRYGTHTETATFARKGDDIFARRADEPGSSRLELTTRYEDALKALDDLK